MQPYDQIEQVHPKITGWCSIEKATVLSSIVMASRPALSVEIGVWFGKSCIPVAIAHKHLAYGCIMAIDPWFADASAEGQVNPADEDWWKNQKNHDLAYTEFMRVTHELGLQNVINVVRKSSNDVEVPDNIGLLSLDGNHGKQAINDVKRYGPKIKLGGYLVADDLHWSGNFVEMAIALLPDMGFTELYRVEKGAENWAVFQRTR